MTIEGVDYSYSVPPAASLIAAGKRFAVRYGGPGGSGKHLTSAELNRLTAADINVVANAEGSAAGFRGTAAGVSWATSAQAAFSALKMPPDRPIYFSVDWAATAADWPDIDAALRGAASVIGSYAVGVYGSYDTVAHCSSAGTAAWFWQTYAWSAGRLHPASHLYQYRNNVTIGGASVDLTRAMRVDYGQWGANPMTTQVDLTPAAIQAVASKLGADLLNDDSNAARGVAMQLLNALVTPMAYTQGGPGERITERGWGPVSTWTLLEYLFEGVAAGELQLADGTVDSASILARLNRIEEKLGILPAPEPAGE
jgi:hypothetical protein